MSVLEVARAKEDEWEQQRHSYRYRYGHRNYERVLELLSQYIEEPAAPASHVSDAHNIKDREESSGATLASDVYKIPFRSLE